MPLSAGHGNACSVFFQAATLFVGLGPLAPAARGHLADRDGFPAAWFITCGVECTAPARRCRKNNGSDRRRPPTIIRARVAAHPQPRQARCDSREGVAKSILCTAWRRGFVPRNCARQLAASSRMISRCAAYLLASAAGWQEFVRTVCTQCGRFAGSVTMKNCTIMISRPVDRPRRGLSLVSAHDPCSALNPGTRDAGVAAKWNQRMQAPAPMWVCGFPPCVRRNFGLEIRPESSRGCRGFEAIATPTSAGCRAAIGPAAQMTNALGCHGICCRASPAEPGSLGTRRYSPAGNNGQLLSAPDHQPSSNLQRPPFTHGQEDGRVFLAQSLSMWLLNNCTGVFLYCTLQLPVSDCCHSCMQIETPAQGAFSRPPRSELICPPLHTVRKCLAGAFCHSVTLCYATPGVARQPGNLILTCYLLLSYHDIRAQAPTPVYICYWYTCYSQPASINDRLHTACVSTLLQRRVAFPTWAAPACIVSQLCHEICGILTLAHRPGGPVISRLSTQVHVVSALSRRLGLCSQTAAETGHSSDPKAVIQAWASLHWSTRA
ncbi:hypothetical protein M011DRAFT_461882 [Sporormia fimetaria CBS 119925]|uniref:Uncharacterized protein n=1 Tax=Sporormia fimetaria CBS 119925 TaxID=1340428 RepID=A0A6A6V1I9_9PLEO|nr:hypothetical protein M011DRAFT_461882 [Sporormia fimetaria CBS 119925]